MFTKLEVGQGPNTAWLESYASLKDTKGVQEYPENQFIPNLLTYAADKKIRCTRLASEIAKPFLVLAIMVIIFYGLTRNVQDKKSLIKTSPVNSSVPSYYFPDELEEMN